jgi:catechol 2,3-dioxygenase-like lactoylglutathione lyase family enzyme
MSSVTQLDHANIAVSDWQEATVFYRDVVGVEMIDIDDNRVAFRIGPTQLMWRDLRFGARGKGTSVYFRDPDGNLLDPDARHHSGN